MIDAAIWIVPGLVFLGWATAFGALCDWCTDPDTPAWAGLPVWMVGVVGGPCAVIAAVIFALVWQFK